MTVHWEELKRLFHEASSRPRSEWPELVASARDRDPELGDELAALLESHQPSDTFLESSPFGANPLENLPQDPQPRLAPGLRVGPYEIVFLIGAGGMGEVYRARDERLGRDVALKIVLEDLTHDGTRQRRMEQEARAVAMLNHPNILTVYDVGVHEGSPFIVSELLEGETLRAALEALSRDTQTGMSVDEASRIVRETAAGLSAAHARGIVHRDLKPPNLFITREGRVKILDFGLAKVTSADGSEPDPQTASGTVLGTVGYMAPEQIRGERAGPPADIFAMGAIYYELLSGKRPFQRSSSADALAATLTADPVSLRSLRPDVPQEVVAIVDRCLAKQPEARFQSGAELAAALAGGLTTRAGVNAGTTGWPRGRTRIAASAGAMALVAALVVTGWWMTRDRGAAPPDAATLADAHRVVAVMPFKNVSADVTQDYFSTGMTEEIRGQLSKISALRLLSRGAVDRYAEADGRRMALELGAGSVVEGSVRLDQQRVRIAVQLIDARSEHSIWADQYDRELNDIFAVQSEVAIQIAEALQATLSPDERHRVDRRPTANTVAYEIYLKSQTLPPGEREANLKGIQMLREALGLDPGFAAAQARMAYRTLFAAIFHEPMSLDVAEEMAHKAVDLDPGLDSAHAALAAIYSNKGEIANAKLAYLRAMELNPSQFQAMTNLSNLEADLGLLDQSLLWSKRAFQLLPNQPVAYYHIGVPLLYLDHGEAALWLDQAEQRFPNAQRLKILQSVLLFQRNDLQQADARARKAVEASPRDDESLSLLAEVTYLSGARDAETHAERAFRATPDITANAWILPQSPRTRYAYLLSRRGDTIRAGQLLDESLRLATTALSEGNQLPRVPMEIAAIHAVRHETEPALQWLQRAYDAGWRYVRVLESDPMLASVRNEPAFVALVERMKADVAAMAQRVNIKASVPIPPPMRAADPKKQ